MKFTTIHFKGSLISANLLAEIYQGDAPGQNAKDFSLNGKLRLTDEIAASWSDARAYWESFQHGMKRIGENDSGATVTREQWILPLLRSLGFDGIYFSRTAAQVGGMALSLIIWEEEIKILLKEGYNPLFSAVSLLLRITSLKNLKIDYRRIIPQYMWSL